MDAFTIFDKYGLPLLIIALASVFIKRDLWPFLTVQIQQWQADRAKERDAFLSALAELTTAANTGHNARLERDHILSDQLHSLTAALDQLASMVQQNYNTLRDIKTNTEKITPRRTPRRVN
jgi:hypothetical protein